MVNIPPTKAVKYLTSFWRRWKTGSGPSSSSSPAIANRWRSFLNTTLPSRVPYTLKFADYTDEELLLMLAQSIHKKYHGKMQVEDGVQGLYTRIAVRRLGRGRGREGFGNARALQN